MATSRILVHEEHDRDGDLVFFVGLTTYSRRVLDKLAEFAGVDLHFVRATERTSDLPEEPEDERTPYEALLARIGAHRG